MHTIFIVTPCSYLLAGLETLMSSAPFPVQVCRIRHPEDICAISCSGGNRLILVSVPVGEPRVAALAKCFLWRLGLLEISGKMPLLPCVLLSNERIAEFREIPEFISVEILRDVLSEILTYPKKGMRKQTLKKTRCVLSPLQDKILSETLAGKTVEEIAVSLNVSPRAVFAGRTALMNKLGLKNRMALMALSDAALLRAPKFPQPHAGM
ncbi:hypothetical protein KTK71_004515 [Salmonella enterica]|nr:hypothetical protein [Salmonella enterica]EHR1671006.1 hypothetical protein [Salmonella enterica]EHR8097470.1 hypothetical protein [Salmonella enterica]EIE9498678.1 hypothetical protein [Salmonella enterica]EIQ5377547.1 hypothetical protein [Salmonella enterica]